MKMDEAFFRKHEQGHFIWRSGKFFITNYRICVASHETGDLVFSLPIGLISSTEKLGGKKDHSAVSSRQLLIDAQDLRRYVFTFGTTFLLSFKSSIFRTQKETKKCATICD